MPSAGKRTCAISCAPRPFPSPTTSPPQPTQPTHGVEVALLDDHALDDHALDTARGEVRDRVVAAAADALAHTRSGTITIRILPTSRDVLVHSTGNDIVWLESDHGGHPFAPRI